MEKEKSMFAKQSKLIIDLIYAVYLGLFSQNCFLFFFSFSSDFWTFMVHLIHVAYIVFITTTHHYTTFMHYSKYLHTSLSVKFNITKFSTL